MKKSNMFIIAFLLMGVAATITVFIFNTSFAKVTIDAWSFVASLFLIVEALYRIATTNDRTWPNQIVRIMRIIIGVCVFTIHTCQLIYGV